MPLSIKKILLATTALTVITGQALNIINTTLTVDIDVQAQEIAENTFVSEPVVASVYPVYNFNDSNHQNMIAKIDEASVDPVKVARLRDYFNRIGGPLASEAEYFVKAADEYGIDYRLVAAISVVESSGGKYCYRPYNCWGWGGQGRAFVFTSYEQAIYTVSRGLKEGYYNKGATTPEQIGRYYNPESHVQWSGKVRGIMNQM